MIRPVPIAGRFRESIYRLQILAPRVDALQNILTMQSLVEWKRLVRYTAHDGGTRLGDPQIGPGDDILALAKGNALTVAILSGLDPIAAKATGEHEKVKELLAPLTSGDVPFIRCIGLNYKTHSTPPTLVARANELTTSQSWRPVVLCPHVQQCLLNQVLL